MAILAKWLIFCHISAGNSNLISYKMIKKQQRAYEFTKDFLLRVYALNVRVCVLFAQKVIDDYDAYGLV